MVDRTAIANCQNLVGLNMTEHGDLGLDSFIQSGLFTAAGYQVRRETQSSEITDGGLSGLGLLFTNGSDRRDQGDMDQCKVVVADTELELAHCLHKRCRFDITDGASEFNNADIGLFASVIHRDGGNALDPVLNGIGNVGYNLNGLAEVVALALTLNHISVDFAGRDVVGAREGHVKVALVVSKIEIDLTAVVQDEDFTCIDGRGCECMIQNERLHITFSLSHQALLSSSLLQAE